MQYKRLYISSDIEGVSGVASIEQLMPEGFEYEQARKWMTAEVAVACEAAFACGVEEIVVSDSHGNGQNLLLDMLPSAVQVVRSWPRPLGMMEGVDVGQYDGALLLGYHTGATALSGVLAHTLSGQGIREVRLNNIVASETVISAAIAGHFGVAIVLASGDDAYTEHAKAALGDIETVTTKWAANTTSARMRAPVAVREELDQKVRRALTQPQRFTPYSLSLPIELSVRCASRKSAELAEYLPGIERVDAYTICTQAEDMVAVSKLLLFLMFSGVLAL